MKLHLDAPVLVGPDLLALLADDQGRLRPGNAWLRRLALGTKRDGRGRGGERIAVLILRGLDADAAQHVGVVGRLEGVVLQRERIAGREVAAIALPDDGLAAGLARIHPNAGPCFSFAGVGIQARIFVDPQAFLVARRRGKEVGLGCLEIIIVEGELAGGQRLLDAHRADGRVARVVVGRSEHFGRGEVGQGLEGGIVVGQDEGVFAVFVFEEVKDALFFHEPGDKIKRRFPVLDAELALGVLAFQRELIVRKAQVRKDSLDDVGGRFVLEDTMVFGERKLPQPRRQAGVIDDASQPFLFAHPLADHPVDVPKAALLHRDLHRNVLADDLRGVHFGVGAFQHEGVFEERGERFFPLQIDQREVIAQRRGYVQI